MKILMINKFLYPNGGSETYMLNLGKYLEEQGHQVQYFGMEHKHRCVGNRVDSYTSNMDFHNGPLITKALYPIKTIYSGEARRKIRKVLDDFEPDVCHINNFNYQLTPSIILEIEKWRKQKKRSCRIVYTAHDYQLVCPNHMLYDLNKGRICEKCIEGSFTNCIKAKCIHNSLLKSLIGSAEAYLWNGLKVYKYIDVVVCPSDFIKSKLDTNYILKNKTVVLHNFINKNESGVKEFGAKELNLPEKYVLYFGRYSKEKGILTFLEVCKKLSNINFVFIGRGNLKKQIEELDNVIELGFQENERLLEIIKRAQFCVCPSEWYEVYGLSNAEAIQAGVPVIASNIGGIPEVIHDQVTGLLFSARDEAELMKNIEILWEDKEKLSLLKMNCYKEKCIYVNEYVNDLFKIYLADK